MKKISCKIEGKKGYLILDDNNNFVGQIWEFGVSRQDDRWRWMSSNGNAWGTSAKIISAIEDLLSFY